MVVELVALTLPAAQLTATGNPPQYRYRKLGDSLWTNADLLLVGGSGFFNTAGLSSGEYEFDTTFADKTHSQGTFSITTKLVNTQIGIAHEAAAYGTSVYWQTRYNAFGEIEARGINDGWQEYFDYDNAGRLWRTNSGDGVDKVYLYDLVGQKTADLISPSDALARSTLDLNELATATSLDVTRTDYVFDRASRLVEKRLPQFTTTGTIESRSAALTFEVATLTAIDHGPEYHDAVEYSGEQTDIHQEFDGYRIVFNWNAMAAWGGGDVFVTIMGSTQDGVPISQTLGFASGEADTGVAFMSAIPLTQITRFVVEKVDANNQKVVIHDRTTLGTYARHLVFDNPTELGESNSMSVDGKPVMLHNFGNRTYADLKVLGLSAGTHNYEINYQHRGASDPYARAGGTLSINGVNSSITQGSAVYSTITRNPITRYVLDRWGNTVQASNVVQQGTLGALGGQLSDSVPYMQTRYDWANRAIQVTSAAVDVYGTNTVGADYGKRTERVSIYNYYDAAGRLIANRDGNGNLNGHQYDSLGNKTAEFHADGSITYQAYDKLGYRISTTDGNGNTTRYRYDRMGRATAMLQPVGNPHFTSTAQTTGANGVAVTRYTYDEAGNLIQTENANKEKQQSWYNTRGQLVATALAGRQETHFTYDEAGNKIRESDANGNFMTWDYQLGLSHEIDGVVTIDPDDGYFGRWTSHRDLDGKQSWTSYNGVGSVLRQWGTRGQDIRYEYYENGAVARITDLTEKSETWYSYDVAGNRTRERFAKGGTVSGVRVLGGTIYQDNIISFDALSRVTQVHDNRYDIKIGYDGANNRRFSIADYADANDSGKPFTHVENWYLYDAMNRITLSQGKRDGTTGVIDLGDKGVQMAYDAAGNRRFAYFKDGASNNFISENYLFDYAGRLVETRKNGVMDSRTVYDNVGRVIEQTTEGGANRGVSQYNSNGWLTLQENYNASGGLKSRVTYMRYDQVGNVLQYKLDVPGQYWNTYDYSYKLFDDYKEQVVSGNSNYFLPGNTTTSYDVNGNIVSVVDQFGANKNRNFVTTLGGQILYKTENGKAEYYFYVNDKPSGSTGANGAGDFDFNYSAVTAGSARSVRTYTVQSGDNLRSIARSLWGDASLWYLIADANGLNSENDVRVGQTLTIPTRITNLHNNSTTYRPYNAGAIIGDTTPTLNAPPPPQRDGGNNCDVADVIFVVLALCWAAADLYFSEGQTGWGKLINACMQAEAIYNGDQEDWDHESFLISAAGDEVGGMAGNYTAGATEGLPAAVSGAAAGAASAAASVATTQALNVATGRQDKFNWKQVAIAALSGAAGGAVGGAGKDWGVLQRAAAAAATNVAVQGVSIALDVQDKFDWRQTAIAAVAAGVSAGVKGALKDNTNLSAFERGAWSSIAGDAARLTMTALMYKDGKMDFVTTATDVFRNAWGAGKAEVKTEQERKAELEKELRREANRARST
ncbi:MAG: LysM peptidoglycan-binding domain-containing protein [Rhodocyclaceae bacterium]